MEAMIQAGGQKQSLLELRVGFVLSVPKPSLFPIFTATSLPFVPLPESLLIYLQSVHLLHRAYEGPTHSSNTSARMTTI